jgi:hydrogenase maturation protease
MMSFHSPAAHDKPVLILGLGNPILGDDGVGWRVAEALQERLGNDPELDELPAYEIDCSSVGGLSLMERMVGYDIVILIDAMFTGQAELGVVSDIHLDELPNRAWGHLSSSHDTTLHNALEVGRQMGAKLPQCVQIIGIEAENVFDFSEKLSPAIAAAIPTAVEKVIQLLISRQKSSQNDPAKEDKPI